MLKPTILVGHGAFGREVLRRLLRKTAPRGSLVWATGTAAGAGHRLRDLALLWMPGTGGEARDHQGADTDGEADFLRDLYRQIRPVEARPGAAERAFCDAVADAAAWLRRPELQQQRPDALPGLDLCIITHIDGPADIAALDSMTRAALTRLADDNPVWRVGVASKRTLHCIEVLDFDNYRGGSDGGAMRRALRRSMEAWKVRLEQRVPALDRAWLLDGRARDSHRDQKSRLDEVTLFIEFLLFAGVRGEEGLKALYQQDGQDQQIAAAFGIRLLERSPALLCRVAAARFGAGWVRWLRGVEGGAGQPASRLATALAPLLVEAGGNGNQSALAEQWSDGVSALAQTLLGLAERRGEDWPARAQAHFDTGMAGLQRDLQRAALARLAGLRERHLADDGQALAGAITADLHDALAPVPLAAVIETLDGAMAGLRTKPVPATPPPVVTLARSVAAHRGFSVARASWLAGHGRGLAAFWPLLAALLALAATPFALVLLRQLPLLAGSDQAARRALADLIDRWDQPAYLALALFALLWPLLYLTLQRPIVAALRRARGFWLDPARGRLTAAIRADCAALHGLLTQAQGTLRSALAADLLRVLGALRERLHRRERELVWLGGQLEEFQRMQGLAPGTLRLEPPADGAHRLLLADDDLPRLMQRQPAERARFLATLPALPAPFADWQAPWLERFLDLFGFVDRLSQPYLEQARGEASGDPDGPEWQRRRVALAALLAQPGFTPGFRSDADKRSSSEQSAAVLPADWRGQPAVTGLLDQAGFRPEWLWTGADPARVYLLRFELGLGLDALEPNP